MGVGQLLEHLRRGSERGRPTNHARAKAFKRNKKRWGAKGEKRMSKEGEEAGEEEEGADEEWEEEEWEEEEWEEEE